MLSRSPESVTFLKRDGDGAVQEDHCKDPDTDEVKEGGYALFMVYDGITDRITPPNEQCDGSDQRPDL